MKDSLQISIHNMTAFTLEDILFGHPGNPGYLGEAVRIAELRPGESVELIRVPANQANYRGLLAKVQGVRHRFMTFDFTDYFGEVDLPPGTYSFSVIDASDGWLSVEIERVDQT